VGDDRRQLSTEVNSARNNGAHLKEPAEPLDIFSS